MLTEIKSVFKARGRNTETSKLQTHSTTDVFIIFLKKKEKTRKPKVPFVGC